MSFTAAFMRTFQRQPLHFLPLPLKKSGTNMVCEPLAGIEPEQSIVTVAVSSSAPVDAGRHTEEEGAPVSVECFAQVALCYVSSCYSYWLVTRAAN